MTADYFAPFFASILPVRVGFLDRSATRQLLANPDPDIPPRLRPRTSRRSPRPHQRTTLPDPAHRIPPHPPLQHPSLRAKPIARRKIHPRRPHHHPTQPRLLQFRTLLLHRSLEPSRRTTPPTTTHPRPPRPPPKPNPHPNLPNLRPRPQAHPNRPQHPKTPRCRPSLQGRSLGNLDRTLSPLDHPPRASKYLMDGLNNAEAEV